MEKVPFLTFGDKDCSPTSLRSFIDHFEIVATQNQRRQVHGWGEANYRAQELRFHLRGEPALWCAQEYATCASWTRSDVEITRKLKDRYIGSHGIEFDIIEFEELAQIESESLEEYMARCQGKGMEVFWEMDGASTQQRIVWKFVSGIRDTRVRDAVKKGKWMASNSRKEAKSCVEVLRMAQLSKLSAEITVIPVTKESVSDAKKEEAPVILYMF